MDAVSFGGEDGSTMTPSSILGSSCNSAVGKRIEGFGGMTVTMILFIDDVRYGGITGSMRAKEE
jgi:hypothetical protein